MTEADKKLLLELEEGDIDEAAFLQQFSVDLKNDHDFIRAELQVAMKSADSDALQRAIALVWFHKDILPFLDLLNELLINPFHTSHQQIAKVLQDDAPSPTTVPYVRKALESNFDYLEYTGSESDAIAKWFSWLLNAIGTKEAVDLMKEYSHSPDEGIANEMRYRLKKIQ